MKSLNIEYELKSSFLYNNRPKKLIFGPKTNSKSRFSEESLKLKLKFGGKSEVKEIFGIKLEVEEYFRKESWSENDFWS